MHTQTHAQIQKSMENQHAYIHDLISKQNHDWITACMPKWI